MRIYIQNEQFTVWIDTSTYLCYLQMEGQEIEPKAYDLASDCIEEGASKR